MKELKFVDYDTVTVTIYCPNCGVKNNITKRTPERLVSREHNLTSLTKDAYDLVKCSVICCTGCNLLFEI